MTTEETTGTEPEIKDEAQGTTDGEQVSEAPAEAKPTASTAYDKQLQKTQMELGNANRLMNAVLEKLNRGETLTPKEEKRLEKTRAFLKKNEGDPVSDDEIRGLATDAVETDERIAKVERELADEKAARLEEKQKREQLEDELDWSRVKAKFGGIDCDAIFAKSVTDAKETLGEGAPAELVSRLASKTFDERVEAAYKRKFGKPAVEQKLDITRGAGKVSSESGGKLPAQMSERDQIMQLAKGCIVKT